jgi:hypothetical protein
MRARVSRRLVIKSLIWPITNTRLFNPNYSVFLDKQVLLVSLLLVASAGAACKHVSEQAIPATDLNTTIQDPVVTNLAQMYRDAQDQFARRAVCLRAIDEGTIRPGVPIETIDQIFGTQFKGDKGGLLSRNVYVSVIHFEPDKDVPQGPLPEARGFSGWFLAVYYDEDGILRNYLLSNIHKGFSQGEMGKTASPIAVLTQAYASAKTETERREICLRAIDEGVIRTWGDANISAIDTIFGTDLASKLPTKKQHERSSEVHFVVPATQRAEVDRQAGWFLTVSFNYDGEITDYSLTNIHK